MAPHSILYGGIPTYEYKPLNYQGIVQNSLFSELDFGIRALGEDLLTQFKGKIIKMKDVYLRHNFETPYVEKNYKDALLILEEEGKIIAKPENRIRRSGKLTMGDDVEITFK